MKNIIKVILASSLCFLIFTTNASAINHLIGYWQNFTNPAEMPVRLTSINNAYDIIIIAFADMNADGNISFILQGPPYSAMPEGGTLFKNDIKALQAKGKKVLISLGGQNGNFEVDTPLKENNFIQSMSDIINTYGFDGIDYDLENGLTRTNAIYLLDATRRLKQKFAANDKSLFITNAPETIDVYWQVFPNGKYDELLKGDLIDLVQVQLYNSGCMPGMKPNSSCYTQGSEDFIVSQADSTIQTWIKNGIHNPVNKYVIGLPATLQAAGGGYTNPQIVKKALACLTTQTDCATYVPTQTYPQLNNLMTWSINWDAKNNYQFAQSFLENK